MQNSDRAVAIRIDLNAGLSHATAHNIGIGRARERCWELRDQGRAVLEALMMPAATRDDGATVD